jgi:hypothetical protein
MAAGDLSPDQARYVDLVASETGLARTVVVAWVGAESGWGTNKAGHNYLNIGPGRTYPSTEQAAASVAGLLNSSDVYYAIRAAIPAGPAAQIKAIGESRWGTSAATLTAVYAGLAGGGPTIHNVNALSDAAGAAVPGLAPLAGALGGALGSTAQGAADAVTGAAGSAVADAFKGLVPVVLEAGLGLVFTVAAFAFIAMGVNRLTGAPPKGIFDTVSGAVGTAAGAAKLAAI